MENESKFVKSLELNRKVHNLIPGGAHTYSKGDDQFPATAPKFIERGKGAYVWDMDGNKFLDWAMGLRSVILGYGYPCVLNAVKAQLKKGPNFTRPSPIEYELAELFTQTIPSAEMVKFTKNGSDANNAAIKLSRAYTGREKIAFCKDHPFFSVEDWFIGTTPCNSGVPKCVQELSIPFRYNDLDSLKQAFEQNKDQIACVIMEPATMDQPKEGFLQGVKQLCNDNGTVFILDEVITGFRFDSSGAQKYFGVTPDLSTFGKAIANGFSLSALVGKREIMERGGLKHDKERVFLMSTTHGAETQNIAAAIATIKEIKEKNVVSHLWRVGKSLKEGINALAKEYGLEQRIIATGFDCSPVVLFKDETGAVSMPLKTLFTQELARKGVLFPYIAPSFSHNDAELNKTFAACEKAFKVCKKAIKEGDIIKHLETPDVLKPVFRRHN